MTENFILYALLGVSVWVAISFLTKATGKPVAADESGYYNLRMNKLYGVIGITCLVVGLLMLVFLAPKTESTNRGIWIVIIVMLLIFWGTGIPCIMYYLNHKVRFDKKSIMVTNVYGKVREIKWADILDVRFNAFSGLLVLTTKADKVKVHQHLVGLSQFIEFMENETEWTRNKLKVPLGKG